MTEACSKSSLIDLAKPDSTSLFGGESITVWRTRSNTKCRRTPTYAEALFGCGPVLSCRRIQLRFRCTRVSGINVTSVPPATPECNAIHNVAGLSDPLRLAITSLMQDQMSDLPRVVFHKGNLGVYGRYVELRIGLGEQFDWWLPGSLSHQAVAFSADCKD